MSGCMLCKPSCESPKKAYGVHWPKQSQDLVDHRIRDAGRIALLDMGLFQWKEAVQVLVKFVNFKIKKKINFTTG